MTRAADPFLAPVLLSGGGTAGHLAPGFALREALEALGVRAVFATPGDRREREWFPAGEEAPIRVPASRLPTRPLPMAVFPLRMGSAVLRALTVLRRVRPSAVVALGGWPCAPLALAALAARVPLALVGVDAVPGVVVRRLARRAGRVYLAFESAAAALPRGARTVVTGPLLRAAAASGRRDPARFGLVPGRRTLLVVGGSLGAKGLNAAAVSCLAVAAAREPALRGRVQVIHSVGPGAGEAEQARRVYAEAGILAHVTPYCRAMGDALATADLVLCRGGASTLAEVEAQGKTAVVVPYPHHADRQQWANALPLVQRGGAMIVEEEYLTPDVFRREVLDRLAEDRVLSPVPARGGRSPRGAALAAADLVRWMKAGATDGLSLDGLGAEGPAGDEAVAEVVPSVVPAAPLVSSLACSRALVR